MSFGLEAEREPRVQSALPFLATIEFPFTCKPAEAKGAAVAEVVVYEVEIEVEALGGGDA